LLKEKTMATEEGIVKKITGKTASVLVKRSEMCTECSSQGACKTLGGGKDLMVDAINNINAKEGERVLLNIDSSSAIKLTFIVYMLPVIMLLAGSIAGIQIGNNISFDPELLAVLLGLGGFILSFFGIIIYGKKQKDNKDYMPVLIKVIKNT
jgi:sigma-E factor negative regulatory protein RseC